MTRSPTTLLERLSAFYAAAGVTADRWHVGPEHPALERVAIAELQRRDGRRVLEIGVQAGGFAIPVIAACARLPGFSYTGVDNHAFPNAVPFSLLRSFLASEGLSGTFVESDSAAYLAAAEGPFDLILLDHWKPLYARDLLPILSRPLIAADGVVMLHDVTGVGAGEWPACRAVARACGWEAEIRTDVPGGLALLRRRHGPRPAAWRGIVTVWLEARAAAHNGRRAVRHAMGRLLRRAGLR